MNLKKKSLKSPPLTPRPINPGQQLHLSSLICKDLTKLETFTRYLSHMTTLYNSLSMEPNTLHIHSNYNSPLSNFHVFMSNLQRTCSQLLYDEGCPVESCRRYRPVSIRADPNVPKCYLSLCFIHILLISASFCVFSVVIVSVWTNKWCSAKLRHCV